MKKTNWLGCIVKPKKQCLNEWENGNELYEVIEDGVQWVDVRPLPQFDKYNLRCIHRWDKSTLKIIG